MKKTTGSIIRELLIDRLEFKGKGVARHNGKVIFVKNALPGEVVDVQVKQKKRNYALAVPLLYHKKSEQRTEPFCEHFGVCGGCTWQNISYETQLEHKARFVEDAFERIGKLNYPSLNPIIGCDESDFYRNKLEFTFSNKRWLSQEEIESGTTITDWNALGFHKPRLFDKVIDITKCWLQADPSNEIRNEVKKFAIENDVPFFDLRNQTGFLRNLTIRTSGTGQVMVLLAFFSPDQENIKKVVEFIRTRFPEINSLNYIINSKKNDSIGDEEVVNVFGKPFIMEEIGNLKFKLGPKSFFQTNSRQAKKLYDAAKSMAHLRGEEVVYDLYSGTGTIALYLSDVCKKVIGIEQVKEAVQDAQENAALNGIDNYTFLEGDVKDIWNEEIFAVHGFPDVVMLDPPRSGIHPKVLKRLIEVKPKKIIYVSCNPATQARDLSVLADTYNITEVQPVDMFPQTFHIENIAALELKVNPA